MARKFKTMDGNTAAAHVSYAFTDVAAIYPITPSTTMSEVTDKWSAEGKENIFGQQVKVIEMQSEAGAAGTVHGSLTAGALTTTFTASQGLLLMIPNMYKMAGELLPCVINVSARAIASHALSIFGDHSDIYACRQTGFAMLGSTNPQEVMDLAAVVHMSAIQSRIPFIHFFDGFRTSHEIQKVAAWDYSDLSEMVDHNAIEEFRNRALNPGHPVLKGTAQNPDIFFQAKESANPYYNALPGIVEDNMKKINIKLNTDYKLFNYYGANDATNIIVAMGSVCDTIEETIDYLNSKGGKYGLVKVRLFRPFVKEKLIEVIPDTVTQINVLDRAKEPGALGEPLYLDIVTALKNTKFDKVSILGGRYGLGSKDTTPSQIIAAFQNTSKNGFTLGIVDDVTNLSLPLAANIDTTPQGITSCKFWGLGADGTVGANKNSIKIIGDHTDMNVQAYFDYDSKKSGGITVSHLRFGTPKIKSTYLITNADFVACHNPSYVDKYDMTTDLKDGGVFLLNCPWTPEELNSKLPGKLKRDISKKNIKLYTIDGVKIAKEIGLGGRINTILQSAFFKLANIISVEDAVKYMKDAATVSYGKKGDQVVKMNHDAIDSGINGIIEVKVPSDWANALLTETKTTVTGDRKDVVDFVNNLLIPMNEQRGNDLPVSAFSSMPDGVFPVGSAAYEKRGIAVEVPSWNPENCIQCNFCSYVCPHSVIRPAVMTDEELKNAPSGTKALPFNGMPGLNFAITLSTLDCTGCSSCANVCPGKKGEKALVMSPIDGELNEQKVFDYTLTLDEKPEVIEKFKETTVKGSQFKQPLLEFSGACAGCGETPYAKLVTQLYGDRMYIANATGCSSIWGGSAPSTPYTVNKAGFGPAWANSLFEDNAEYGYGIYLAQMTIRNRLIGLVNKLSEKVSGLDKDICNHYLNSTNDGNVNKLATANLIEMLKNRNDEIAKDILKSKDYLSKKSVWIFGGDGWAYDIGFGGLDHVLATNEDVNVLVFDTEIYSNTGGQASKATPVGAIAQFAASGKTVKKKDLAAIGMSYGYIYVAQIAQGADYNQTIKAISEAESYNGPSLIIAYAPCISHGLKGGMGSTQSEEKRAVESGYWHLFRFDPRLEEAGKNPFQLDSKEPTSDYKDFILSEVRYSSLARSNQKQADLLFDIAAADAKDKYSKLLKKSQ